MNFWENVLDQIFWLLHPRVLIDVSENGVYFKQWLWSLQTVIFWFMLVVQAGNKKVYAVDMLFILSIY